MSRRNDLGARQESLVVKTEPTDLAVPLSEVKNSLRIDASETSDDALLTALIKGATRVLERVYSLTILDTTYVLYRDDLPCIKKNDPLVSQTPTSTGYLRSQPLSEVRATESTINLLTYPAQAITEVRIFNENNVQSIWAATNYDLDVGSRNSRLLKRPAAVWPTEIFKAGSAIEIEFTAGFGANVPSEIQMAIQQFAEFLYLNRGCPCNEGTMPVGVKALMSPWKKVRI